MYIQAFKTLTSDEQEKALLDILTPFLWKDAIFDDLYTLLETHSLSDIEREQMYGAALKTNEMMIEKTSQKQIDTLSWVYQKILLARKEEEEMALQEKTEANNMLDLF
jgi:hypothetical protein